MPGSADERTRLVGGEIFPSAPKPPRDHHNRAGLPAWRFYLCCLSLWTATFLSACDGTVVATLIGDISSSFQAFHLASWLGTAYLLSLCCFTPVYGRLADAIGRRNAQLVALVLFTLGTAGCAVAPTMYTLIAARVVAGIGGGGLTSVASILLSDLVDLRYRGLYQGMANTVYAFGASLGGPVGGWTADRFGWRAAFGVQVPLLLLSIAAITIVVPADLGYRTESAHSTWFDKIKGIDYLGSALLGISVSSLLLSVSLKTAATTASGKEYAWSDPTIWGLLIVSLVFMVIFLYVEAYYATEPVLPLSMFKRRTPLSVALCNVLMAMCIFSMLYNLPLFFIAVQLKTSTVAGLHLLPFSLLIGCGSLGAGAIMRVTGRYYASMVGSGLLILLSCGLMMLWGEKTPAWVTWVAPAPSGLGYAGALTSTLVALISDVTKSGMKEVAVGTSMTYVARTIGQVLGVSFSSAILQATLETDLARTIKDPAVAELIRRSTAVIKTLPKAQKAAAVAAYSHGLARVWIFNFALAAATVLCMSFADNDYMKHDGEGEGEEAQA